ncbi:putative transcriptional regulatory protein ykoG [Proteiniborus sp. DW1]|nr:putative transcriptional regulatory protein ykoG [Proteiniborus sp. DW1]
MLPELNGIEVLRRIRRVSDIPIILLTARDAVVDKVTGLDGGADDYITKPFAIEELLARIRVALRKRSNTNLIKAPAELNAGMLTLDPIKREVRVGETSLDLTKREFDLLQYLLENKNIVISRETLLQHIWGYDFSGGTNAVDVYIRYLRSKVEEPFGLKLIHTVRGVGYVIKDE